MMKAKPFTIGSWSLVDLFSSPTGQDIENAFLTARDLADNFEKNRALLVSGLTQNRFMQIIGELEILQSKVQRLSAYSGLWFSENTQNQDALSLMGRIDQFTAELSNRLLFFGLWWKALDKPEAQRLMSGAGDYAYWLEEMRHFKEFTLSEPEEKIINIKDVTGSNGLKTLYESITNRYTFKIQPKRKKITRGELMVFVRHHDPDIRKAAYQELYRVYSQEGPILGQIYQNLVRDWRNEQVQLRGFSSPLSARNLANDIPDEVTDTLLEVCRRNTAVFQRYFRLKAGLLGMDRLRRYDIYAPIQSADKSYPFHKAADLVFDAFKRFDPSIAALAMKVLAENHLDSQVRQGKNSGAFCMSVLPGITPWVLLNYQGRSNDVATMAHELGHAIHSMLAASHPLFTFHSSLPLAETASTFGEMLLVDRLLEEEEDPRVRRDLVFQQIDDAYATIHRQAFFAMFEKQAHELIHQNATVDDLSAAYMQNLKQQFGDAVTIPDEFRWEWVSIPHFYNVPFYVYAYSFGQLLVLALYQQYRAEGEAFKPRYLKILAAGGSVAPVKLLQSVGIDIKSPDFWQGGFQVIDHLIDELEEGG